MKFSFQGILLLLSFVGILSVSCRTAIEVHNLQVELLSNPIAIDVQQPRLSWQLTGLTENLYQSAYQILVSSSEENNLSDEKDLYWNSGKVISDNSVLIPYEGPLLESGKTYYWTVKVWTNKGKAITAESGSWRMAYTKESDWKAQWIGMDSITNPGEQIEGVIHTRLSARYLRKEFQPNDKIKSAILHISGLGMYECYLNGKKVGDAIFAPTATDYDKQVNYNSYDVTSLVLNDKNTVGVILGNGRFVGVRMATDTRYGVPATRHFGFPKMSMQLELELENGSKQLITSDTSWKLTTKGPIVANSEFDGEEYDARLEMPGWNANGFDDSQWMVARKVTAPNGKLIAQRNPNIKTMEEITPVSIKKVGSTYILDMGQNMVGWLSVRLKGQKNDPVRMRFAESLQPDGNLYMDNLRGAQVTNIYIPAKDGNFSWSPLFTYQGFRYAEISGIDYLPELTDFTGKVNYDEMETIGSFETSDSLLNRIYKNAYWGIKGNYRSFPTDCPQRDERMPWLGDRATGCFGESFMFENTLLYEKWVQDIEDSQRETGSLPDVAPNYWQFYSDNVTWPSAFIHTVNMLYEQRGDIHAVKKHYPSMKKWMLYMKTNYMKNYLIEKDVYGDWCMPPERLDLIHSQDPARKTDGTLLATSFYYQLLNILVKFAEVTDNQEDKKMYSELAVEIKKAYNEKFLNTATGYYSNNTVTANLVSLMQNLVPDDYQSRVFNHIVAKTEGEFNSHVGVGLIGIQFLMRGLTKFDRGDLAYRIATNKTYPSWGYMIENNATTIWELWNGITADPAMNSGNHVMLLGDLMAWFYEDLAGIKTDKSAVGFKKIIMKPIFPTGLSFVKASTRSPYGVIKSEWNKSDKSLDWKIEIPANSSADVWINASSLDKITCNQRSVKSIKHIRLMESINDMIRLEVPSGSYHFIVEN
ncbi:MAG: family 78 glycoside hydrolase catalytic domain [Paludibacter sp.]|jgi:alpha-L-rhamnosidase|nr:family 78 glycoside hydrolase catalytic domain [Paludibacter sp.]